MTRADSIAAVPDLKLLKRYLLRCEIRNIATRTLLCSSDYPWPLLENREFTSLARFLNYLGYDYCTPWEYYSAVHGELLFNTPPELQQHSARLNEYGLFNSRPEIEEFVVARWKYAERHPSKLEDGAEFVIVRIDELDRQVFARL